ncbi:tail fiber domain-containing protein [uncultured Prevotella sp.]|jgi:hypothetical protein|uniref:tail fiber domain-containing protein n=1 Tax=uncultured Prevotella sp. TaxID=159272 RepID=UPI00265CB50E|nr:tail fiber domain-containing protein [uncultured Prevotella sp.]
MKFLDLTGLSHFLDKLKSLKGADNGFAGLDKNGFVEEDQLLYRSKEVIYFTKQVSSTTMASVGTSLINPKQVVYDKSKKRFVATNASTSVYTSCQAAWAQTSEEAYKASSSFGSQDGTNGITPKTEVIYYDEELKKTYIWNGSYLEETDYSVDGDTTLKHIFFNKSSSVTSPSNTVSHDINITSNKVGFQFVSPLVATYVTSTDPINSSRPKIQTIQVTMLDATSARNGYMTKTQASQLSSLYTSHGNKSYLPLSGGTVNGNVTVNGKITANGLVIPVNYYAKYESWLAQSFINDFGGKAECSFQTYTSNGELRFVRQTKANVDVADGQGNYTYIVYNANGNIQLANQRTTINYSDGSITTPKVTQTSDKRLKENINTITEDLDKIKEIEFFEFNLNDDVNKTKSYGVIAQDLEKVGLENLVVEDANGYKAVDYTALIMLELQRQRKVIAALEKRLAEIEKTWSWK